MLSKSRRVSKTLFETALTQSRFFENGLFTFRLHQVGPVSPTFFGVTVPKKLLKRSVDRHLLKRRVYQALSLVLPEVKPGFVGLFFYRGKGEIPPQEAISSDILALLFKARLLEE
jgi:ribonuclease P protein component